MPSNSIYYPCGLFPSDFPTKHFVTISDSHDAYARQRTSIDQLFLFRHGTANEVPNPCYFPPIRGRYVCHQRSTCPSRLYPAVSGDTEWSKWNYVTVQGPGTCSAANCFKTPSSRKTQERKVSDKINTSVLEIHLTVFKIQLQHRKKKKYTHYTSITKNNEWYDVWAKYG